MGERGAGVEVSLWFCVFAINQSLVHSTDRRPGSLSCLRSKTAPEGGLNCNDSTKWKLFEKFLLVRIKMVSY